MTRQEKARNTMLLRNIEKVPAATLKKIQDDAAAEAVDRYQREHGLGQYASTATAQIAKEPSYPTFSELTEVQSTLQDKLYIMYHKSTKEEVKLDVSLALHHLAAIGRLISKATKK